MYNGQLQAFAITLGADRHDAFLTLGVELVEKRLGSAHAATNDHKEGHASGDERTSSISGYINIADKERHFTWEFKTARLEFIHRTPIPTGPICSQVFFNYFLRELHLRRAQPFPDRSSLAGETRSASVLAQKKTAMALKRQEWLKTQVQPFRKKPVSWLSQYHFFRDPVRPTYSDPGYFFSPADGILLYQRRVRPDEAIVEIKGRVYSLRDALRDPDYAAECIVIGIFMTFFDVHINRVPYSGRLCFKELDPIDTYNHPMIGVEDGLFRDLRISPEKLEYLHPNQRMVNRIYSPHLGQSYYVLQIADYDVDCITHFSLKQNEPVIQGERFSQVRFGSQVDLIVPVSSRFDFTEIQATGDHVEAGMDPLLKVSELTPRRKTPAYENSRENRPPEHRTVQGPNGANRQATVKQGSKTRRTSGHGGA